MKMYEEAYKLEFAKRYFSRAKYTFGRIDIRVYRELLFSKHDLIHCEFKKDDTSIKKAIAQVIVTSYQETQIKNEATIPFYFMAVNNSNAGFLPFYDRVFTQGAPYWSETPSSMSEQSIEAIWDEIKNKSIIVDLRDEKILRQTINNIIVKKALAKQIITKNNYLIVFSKWYEEIGKNIKQAANSKEAKIQINDLFLSDIAIDSDDEDKATNELFKVKRENGIILFCKKTETKISGLTPTYYFEGAEIYDNFWRLFKRPPYPEDLDLIKEKKGYLLPLELQRIQGTKYTPMAFVSLCHSYLAKALGEDWQDKYLIVDNCAGTGNLEQNLNQSNCYLSTFGEGDTKILKDKDFPNVSETMFLCDKENSIFSEYNGKAVIGDFLANDQLPLFKYKDGKEYDINEIAKKENKRILVLMNPPYVEGVESGKDFGKWGTLTEKFMQFLIKSYDKMPGCVIAMFSKLKYINSYNSMTFRKEFRAKFLGGFVMPSKAFGLHGSFPIGFLIWDTNEQRSFPDMVELPVFDCEFGKTKDGGKTIKNVPFIFNKNWYSLKNKRYISEWLKQNNKNNNSVIGSFSHIRSDFQQQHFYSLLLKEKDKKDCLLISEDNMENVLSGFSALTCVKYTNKLWWMDRDQFLAPEKELTQIFKNNSLIFSIFSAKNMISNVYSDTKNRCNNYFIPFTAKQLNMRAADFKPIADKFDMREYISKREFSKEAKDVFNAGLEIWKLFEERLEEHKFKDDIINELKLDMYSGWYQIRQAFVKEVGLKSWNEDKLDKYYTTTIFNNFVEKYKILGRALELDVYKLGLLLK